MSHTPHDLTEEFPEKMARIHALRESNPHFRKLTDTYNAVNVAVYQAETRIKPTDEAHEEQLRRQRLLLKDQIAAILAA